MQMIFFGFVLLLAACTSAATEPAATVKEMPVTTDEMVEEMPVTTDEMVEAEADTTAVDDEAAMDTETAVVNETAVKPQFIMFTASW